MKEYKTYNERKHNAATKLQRFEKKLDKWPKWPKRATTFSRKLPISRMLFKSRDSLHHFLN